VVGSWQSACADFEQCFPATPEEKSSSKKFRRFQKLPGCKEKREKGKVLVSCLKVARELFHKFAPPVGPVQLGLEDLVHITAEKRILLRLAERRIQVTGRRMEKFVPPIWKPKQKCSQNVSEVVSPVRSLKEQKLAVEVPVPLARRKESNFATRRDQITSGDQMVPGHVEEGAEMEFFEQG
jgi:hypothetical protein